MAVGRSLREKARDRESVCVVGNVLLLKQKDNCRWVLTVGYINGILPNVHISGFNGIVLLFGKIAQGREGCSWEYWRWREIVMMVAVEVGVQIRGDSVVSEGRVDRRKNCSEQYVVYFPSLYLSLLLVFLSFKLFPLISLFLSFYIFFSFFFSTFFPI